MLQDIFRLLACLFQAFGIDFPIRPGQRRLDQNVPHIHLLRYAVVFAVLVVIGLKLVMTNRGLRLDPCVVDDYVPDLPLLWYGIVVGSLVAIVEGFQLGLSRVNLLQQIILAQHGVIELYFRVFLFKLAPDLRIRDQHAAGDQVTQFVEQDFVFYTAFELGNGQIRRLQPHFIFLLANEFSSWEERRGVTPMLQFIHEFFVRGAQPQAFCLGQKCLAADEVLRGL